MKANQFGYGRPRYPWRPLWRASRFLDPAEDLIAETMASTGLSREDSLRFLERQMVDSEIWINDIYQVQVSPAGATGFYRLCIRRRDGGPILRDWRHFQAIKNQLLGEECEAIELYPAESRKVDQTNKFHLWGWRDSAIRFPFGFPDRQVDYQQRPGASPGLRQRPA